MPYSTNFLDHCCAPTTKCSMHDSMHAGVVMICMKVYVGVAMIHSMHVRLYRGPYISEFVAERFGMVPVQFDHAEAPCAPQRAPLGTRQDTSTRHSPTHATRTLQKHTPQPTHESDRLSDA